MLNTYRYATAEELKLRQLRELTPEDQAVMERLPYGYGLSDRLDADNNRRLHEGAQRRWLSISAFVTRKEASNREIYG
jgi:hypothetical protein